MPDDIYSYMQEVTDRALGQRQPMDPAPLRQPKPVEPFLETADRHKDAGTRLPGGSRLAFLKKLILRVVRLYTVEQATYNQAMLSTALELHAGLNQVRADLDRRLGTSQALQATLEERLRAARSDIEALAARERELTAQLGDAADRRAADHSDLQALRSRIDMLLEEARRRLPDPFDDDQMRTMAAAREHRLAPLYEQLEARFRGTRAEIAERQRRYVADVAPVCGPDAPVLDIGCGRGEWLEVLGQAGLAAYGVDSNPTFVERNTKRGLDVRLDDAIDHLNRIPEGSLGAVTSFHVIEHLEFPVLVSLVDAALRALRPGGVIILETPNPDNLVVGSSRFYIDPTHRNPLPPEFTEFLVSARGFVHTEVRYLNAADDARFPEPAEPELKRLVDHLNDLLFGPEDYAVLARKPDAA